MYQFKDDFSTIYNKRKAVKTTKVETLVSGQPREGKVVHILR